MPKDKKVLYTISIAVFAVLLASFFINVQNSRLLTAFLISVLAVLTRIVVRKRTSSSINKREVLLLSSLFGILYVVLIEMTGLVFGFYKNPYFVNAKTLFTTVIPIAIIIVAGEIIRSTLIEQKSRLASIMAFLSCLLAELLAFSNLAGIVNFNLFMDMVGLTLFPAISANVYYHYISKNFGMFPNIAFRIISTLYVYFIPNVTAMEDALLACIKIFIPFVLLFIFSSLYSKRKKNAVKKESKLGVIATVLSVAFFASVAMLISCQFRFAAIVIATESMTGHINKGDVIVYEKYDDQKIKEGQVVVFLRDESKIVHRVVKIEKIGGEVRYTTKGDANEVEDDGYITDADIVGLTDVKISYIGYPTLWLRELLEGSN